MESNPLFKILDNRLQFKQVDQNQTDGVTLTEDEQEYLLPHFLMLLVGKPGSGKTTLLKQLLTNPQMYHRKFDNVLIVSPSHAKMGISVKKDHITDTFSLDWIFKHFATFNEEQEERVFGKRAARTIKGQKQVPGKATLSNEPVMNDARSRFMLSDAFRKPPSMADNKGGSTQTPSTDPRTHVDLQKKYEELKKLPIEEQERSHRNVLLVLDDVVGSIKKAEFDPRLAQLVMNRRHIIFNGTISIIMVTQKYTLIPARVRSNANWIILYQLNPLDFETAYRDAVTLSPAQWKDLLSFVYGVDIDTQQYRSKKQQILASAQEDDEEEKKEEPSQKIRDVIKGKKFENLGIWVESNVYFKNFKRIQL